MRGGNNMSFIADALGVMDVFDEYEFSDKYYTIYFNSNERLKEIFSKIDVYDKDVLTVVGSGDQVFYSFYNGARSVDMFDKNKLSIHYYYLRTWVIKYLDKFYPSKLNKKYIKTLLKIVKPHTKEERDSLRFWKIYIKIFTDEDTEELFSYSRKNKINTIRNLSLIKKRIENDDVCFYNVDISKKVDIKKKYDIIFTSNIVDYLLFDEKLLRLYRDNLDSLLKNGGIIVRCHVLKGVNTNLEKRLFLEKFYSNDIPSKTNKKSIGFVYTKK